MVIKEKPLSDIKAYENNPRNNDAAVDAVAESIKQFGFKVPIVIDKDGIIVAGHTRVKAAEKLGLKTVPCIIADDLTPEQIKAFRLADNKTAELAEWDFEKLEQELDGLDIDMSAFGFEMQDEEESELLELDRDEIGTSLQTDNLQFCGKKVLMTEEEAERLLNFYKLYLNANGNLLGFVFELLDNGGKNYES